jgi:hypothetical protein
MMLAIIPVFIINLFIATIISGHLLSTNTGIFSCDNPSGTSACPMTLLDTILDSPTDTSANYDLLRAGRTGTAMLISGLYLIYIGLTILIPNKTDEVSY